MAVDEVFTMESGLQYSCIGVCDNGSVAVSSLSLRVVDTMVYPSVLYTGDCPPPIHLALCSFHNLCFDPDFPAS